MEELDERQQRVLLLQQNFEDNITAAALEEEAANAQMFATARGSELDLDVTQHDENMEEEELESSPPYPPSPPFPEGIPELLDLSLMPQEPDSPLDSTLETSHGPSANKDNSMSLGGQHEQTGGGAWLDRKQMIFSMPYTCGFLALCGIGIVTAFLLMRRHHQ